MDRRQRLCERRQSRRRPQVAPQPPVHTCAEPSDAAWDEYAARFKARYGHRPSRDAHAGKLVMDAEHDGTIVPPVGALPQWAGKVPFDPYVTEGE